MASRRLFDGAQIELGLLPIVGAGAPPPTEINLTPARLDNVNTFYSPKVDDGSSSNAGNFLIVRRRRRC